MQSKDDEVCADYGILAKTVTLSGITLRDNLFHHSSFLHDWLNVPIAYSSYDMMNTIHGFVRTFYLLHEVLRALLP